MVLGLVVSLAVHVYRRLDRALLLRAAAAFNAALGVAQVLAGVGLAYAQMPRALQVLHVTMASLLLGGLSIAVMLVVAIPLGMLAALRRGKATDVISGLVSYLGVSLPEFVTATLLLIVVADHFQLLPATGYVAPSENLVDSIRHLILPVATVSLILVAHVSRMVRSETIDVLNSDYIRAARLKGLPPRTVLMRHVLRNALLPTITIVALDVGYLLGGIIVVEEIFAVPGIGRQLIVAITTRDLPSIQAGAMIMAGTYAIANTLADMAYAMIDKRIRYD